MDTDNQTNVFESAVKKISSLDLTEDQKKDIISKLNLDESIKINSMESPLSYIKNKLTENEVDSLKLLKEINIKLESLQERFTSLSIKLEEHFSNKTQEKEIVQISELTHSKWNTIQNCLGLETQISKSFQFPNGILQVSTVYEWNERLSVNDQVRQCIEYLNDHLPLPDHYQYINVTDKPDFLYTSHPSLPFGFTGAVNVVIAKKIVNLDILNSQMIFVITFINNQSSTTSIFSSSSGSTSTLETGNSVSSGIEVAPHNQQHHATSSFTAGMPVLSLEDCRIRSESQLVAASFKSHIPIVHLVTDLRFDWVFRWMINSHLINYYHLRSAAQACELIKMRLRTLEPFNTVVHPTLAKEQKFINPKKLKAPMHQDPIDLCEMLSTTSESDILQNLQSLMGSSGIHAHSQTTSSSSNTSHQ